LVGAAARRVHLAASESTVLLVVRVVVAVHLTRAREEWAVLGLQDKVIMVVVAIVRQAVYDGVLVAVVARGLLGQTERALAAVQAAVKAVMVYNQT
jgi:hypothetical protein